MLSASVKAAIDCGTNTFRLLIASRGVDGLVEHERMLTFVKLGEGVDATRAFSPDALERAAECFRRYAEIIAQHECDFVRIVATSAARDVTNSADFLELARSILGVEAEIIDGTEEAELSFRGALAGITDATEPILVFDTGGGSTELVVGGADGSISFRRSLNVGSRRILERFLHDDPPTAEQIDAARKFVATLLASESPINVATVIGVAGTVTSLSALVQRLPSYHRDRVHGSILTVEQVTEVTDRLLSATVAEICSWGPVPPERAQVLCAGALIVDELLKCVEPSQLTVSETDLLDGILLKEFAL